MKKNVFFACLMILLFVAACGVAIVEKYQSGSFAQKIASGLSDVSRIQAHAIDTQAEAIGKLTDLSAEVVRAEIERTKAETRVMYTAQGAIVVMVLVLVILAVIAVRRTRKAAAQ